MARRVHVTLESDLSGEPADETVRFGVDGVDYEIDLTAAEAAALREAAARYVAAGRKAGAGSGAAASPVAGLRTVTRGKRKQAARVSNTDAIRQWAREQGIDVGDRGRLPRAVVDAYTAATG